MPEEPEDPEPEDPEPEPEKLEESDTVDTTSTPVKAAEASPAVTPEAISVRVAVHSAVIKTVGVTLVSMVINLDWTGVGKFVIFDGQVFVVEVRVARTVDVDIPEAAVSEGWVVETVSTGIISVAVTGQIVVETTIISVVTLVLFDEAGQLVILEGQAVVVAVRVRKIVEVVDCSCNDPPLSAAPLFAELGKPVEVDRETSVTGQTVVDTTIVSVVTKVVLADAGQSVMVGGQAITVAVRVVRIVAVVELAEGKAREEGCLGNAVDVVNTTPAEEDGEILDDNCPEGATKAEGTKEVKLTGFVSEDSGTEEMFEDFTAGTDEDEAVLD